MMTILFDVLHFFQGYACPVAIFGILLVITIVGPVRDFVFHSLIDIAETIKDPNPNPNPDLDPNPNPNLLASTGVRGIGLPIVRPLIRGSGGALSASDSHGIFGGVHFPLFSSFGNSSSGPGVWHLRHVPDWATLSEGLGPNKTSIEI